MIYSIKIKSRHCSITVFFKQNTFRGEASIIRVMSHPSQNSLIFKKKITVRVTDRRKGSERHGERERVRDKKTHTLREYKGWGGYRVD